MKKKIICIFVITLLIVTVSPAVGMMNVFPSNNSLIEKTGAEDYMMTNWYERQKLVASAGAAVDYFGESVSIDGDYAIIGATYDGNGFRSGSAYIFTRSGTTWTKQAKLLASDGAAYDFFGISVSIDGDYAIIGARGDDDNGVESGSAYVFKRDGTSWTQEDKLLASDGETDDNFGQTVSIDGDYAIIGTPWDEAYGERSGSAYVFKRNGNIWTEQAKLLASDGEAVDDFGYSVSIDGDTALIGAWHDDDNGDGSGSAYVFTRIGNTWTEQTKLLPSDGEENGWFGCSASLDGDTALIGTYDDDNGYGSGSAYVFTRIGNTWTEQAKLLPSDGDANDRFGISVSLDEDTAIIGAKKDEDNGKNSGSAYIFKRNSNIWTEQGKLLPSDGEEWNNFGLSVSIYRMYAIVGSITDNTDGSGSVYVFIENEKPIMPTISGPSSGIPGFIYNYNFTCVDPDGDDMIYYVVWGDGDVDSGIVESGGVLSLFHTWAMKGDFMIRAKLIDDYGLESEWATLEVTMPRNRATNNMLLLRFLEQFPLLGEVLSRLITK